MRWLTCCFAGFLALSCSRDEENGPSASSRTSTASSAAPLLGACSERRSLTDGVRWACSQRGAPVDVLTQRNLIRFVAHEPTLVVRVAPAGGEPETIGAAPDNVHRLVCILEGPAKGLTGYVADTHLGRTRCSAPRK